MADHHRYCQTPEESGRPRRRSGSSIVVLGGDDTLKPSIPIDDYQQELEMYNMLAAEQDNGPHREMAVDVPASFIARNKTPPRYPPPRSAVTPGNAGPGAAVVAAAAATAVAPVSTQLNGSSKPVPPPRDHLRIEKDGRLTNRAPVPAPQVPDRKMVPNTSQHQHIGQVLEPTPDQLDSIKKFQYLHQGTPTLGPCRKGVQGYSISCFKPVCARNPRRQITAATGFWCANRVRIVSQRRASKVGHVPGYARYRNNNSTSSSSNN
ncbi:hypothetical protein AND_009059 [Anopheles darlingi]|uniref:Uncharacterized protein n=1 Tax=Anopheles darlingi TaxID=43151 RepID=W5J4F2_ANODA|nr:hypothetical protein AND_009059 [Anopheles darlingi]